MIGEERIAECTCKAPVEPVQVSMVMRMDEANGIANRILYIARHINQVLFNLYAQEAEEMSVQCFDDALNFQKGTLVKILEELENTCERIGTDM